MNYKHGFILLALLLNILINNTSPMSILQTTEPAARPAGKYFLVETEDKAEGYKNLNEKFLTN